MVLAMKLVNLTPHPISLYRQVPRSGYDSAVSTIQPDGRVARIAEQIEDEKSEFAGWPVVGVDYRGIEGLPAPERNVRYIVSLPVALACPFRSDLLVPYDQVRNETGAVVGCRRLAWPA